MTEAKNTIELKDSERQPCEVWTRVMGYHRPVQSFNIGKKGEFEERVCFTEGCGDSPRRNSSSLLRQVKTSIRHN